MLRGLWKLTWLEIKIFLREPLGAFGSILLSRPGFCGGWAGLLGGRLTPGSIAAAGFLRVGLPVFVSVLIALSGVLSLVTIISIYREGGILKRLRATPLRPQTILTAHVLVKLALTAAHHGLDCAGGQALLPGQRHVPDVRVYDSAADQHVEHPVDRFSDREHCAYGALRATDRRGHPVSDARPLRTVRAAAIAATRAPRRGARAAADLRGVATPGDLERRGVVGAHWRRRGAGRRICDLHGALSEGVSLGIVQIESLGFSCDMASIRRMTPDRYTTLSALSQDAAVDPFTHWALTSS